MDEATVRQHAEAHARAILAGDVHRAAADFVEELRPQVPAIAAQLPRPMVAAEVLSVITSGSKTVVHIRYRGTVEATTLELRWKDRAGRPQIVSLRVI